MARLCGGDNILTRRHQYDYSKEIIESWTRYPMDSIGMSDDHCRILSVHYKAPLNLYLMATTLLKRSGLDSEGYATFSHRGRSSVMVEAHRSMIPSFHFCFFDLPCGSLAGIRKRHAWAVVLDAYRT